MEDFMPKKLKKLRIEHHFSSLELSNHLGVSKEKIEKWEAGSLEPSMDEYLAIADFYHLTLDALLKEEDFPFLDEETIQKSNLFRRLKRFPYPIFATLMYLLFGFCYSNWTTSLIWFLSIPMYYTLIDSIMHKNPKLFCYPVFVVSIYLILGFNFILWHPGWLIFLTIPMYYSLISDPKKKKNNCEDLPNDDSNNDFEI